MRLNKRLQNLENKAGGPCVVYFQDLNDPDLYHLTADRKGETLTAAECEAKAAKYNGTVLFVDYDKNWRGSNERKQTFE